MTVHVISMGAETDLPVYDVTSRGTSWCRAFSPMIVGPVPLYGRLVSQNMENAWQYSKFYPEHVHGDYWSWAIRGWNSPRAHRYPMGKGARPLYTKWAGERLNYIEARRQVYIPLYVQAVRMWAYPAYRFLRDVYRDNGEIALRDFDAYDHRSLGYSWEDVINDPDRKMGHAFVLAMMLEGQL